MGDMADMYDYAIWPEDFVEDAPVTCKYCGEEGLIWDLLPDKKWRLVDAVTLQVHTCDRNKSLLRKEFEKKCRKRK